MWSGSAIFRPKREALKSNHVIRVLFDEHDADGFWGLLLMDAKNVLLNQAVAV